MTITQSPLTAAFDAGFGGTTTRPGDADYDRVRAVWNGTVDRHPALIAHCGSTADVVAAVNLTRGAGVPLAVRGGGHSLPGFSSCDDGVVIDLSGMRAVSVAPDRRTAAVQPGATWADFDAATGAQGLAS